MHELLDHKHYQSLLETISQTYTQGRVTSMQVVNSQLLEIYWQIGRHMLSGSTKTHKHRYKKYLHE